jgi:hypothetical protein
VYQGEVATFSVSKGKLQYIIELSVNLETTGRPFCGFRMSSDVAGGRKKTICHPRFPVQLSWTLPVHVQVKNPSLRCSSIFG